MVIKKNSIFSRKISHNLAYEVVSVVFCILLRRWAAVPG